MSNEAAPRFILSQEYRRFAEFCDACAHYRYIGLCYGPPGVGKTVSARFYANWDKVEAYQPSGRVQTITLDEVAGAHIVVYTPKVVNSPRALQDDIDRWRRHLRQIAVRPISEEEERRVEEVRQIERERRDWYAYQFDRLAGKPKEDPRQTQPNIGQVARECGERRLATPDPTRLIIVDEADRLKMAGLEQVRDGYDRGPIGMVLVGMPGLEKRLSRYPQLYSRIGLVHAFRPLADAAVQALLREEWGRLGGAEHEDDELCDEAVSTIVRVSGGNFRLLHRLLAQVDRILQVNELTHITRQVVEAARESLVIGTA